MEAVEGLGASRVDELRRDGVRWRNALLKPTLVTSSRLDLDLRASFGWGLCYRLQFLLKHTIGWHPQLLILSFLIFQNVDHKMKYKSKKGQLPFIEVNGEEIADSAIIIKQLGEKFNTDLDAGLSAEQKLVAHSNISMIENHFAWVLKSFFTARPELMLQAFKVDLQKALQKPLPSVILNFLFKRKIKAVGYCWVVKWWRCRCPGEWVRAAKLNLQQALNTRIPNAVLNFAFKLRFKQAAKKVRAHGIGVHKPEEIEEFGQNDLKVLSDLLGDKTFFFGESPSTLDVVAFANLAQLVYMDPDVSYSLRDWLLENCPNLRGFCDRLKERAFPDWDEMCSTLDLNSHLPKPPPEEEKKEEKEEAKEKKEEAKEEKKEEEKETDEKEKAQKEEDAADKDDNKKTEENEK
ncbi:Metaxin glutathione S-transferase domain [Trinorchestia longiramus]|nr:Metaxin glutathione S-transferase domain [Trinorchestia longiramus]